MKYTEKAIYSAEFQNEVNSREVSVLHLSVQYAVLTVVSLGAIFGVEGKFLCYIEVIEEMK